MAEYVVKYRNDIVQGIRIDPSYYVNKNEDIEKLESTHEKLSKYIDIPTTIINLKNLGDYFSYIDIASVDIINGIIRAKKVKKSEAPSRARKVVKEGDVIISSVRPREKCCSTYHKKRRRIHMFDWFYHMQT